ncbi:MAG: hypothetical protein H6922_00360 [Pseudomonadaceae bacterium]|nr:hypothetical protein [Pseudomonadaceae bacterium]
MPKAPTRFCNLGDLSGMDADGVCSKVMDTFTNARLAGTPLGLVYVGYNGSTKAFDADVTPYRVTSSLQEIPDTTSHGR